MDSQYPSLYDVGQAVRLAEYACDRTQTSDLNSIQTLVDAYRLQGKLDRAQTLLDRCLTVATRTGNRALGSGCQEQAAALGR